MHDKSPRYWVAVVDADVEIHFSYCKYIEFNQIKK